MGGKKFGGSDCPRTTVGITRYSVGLDSVFEFYTPWDLGTASAAGVTFRDRGVTNSTATGQSSLFLVWFSIACFKLFSQPSQSFSLRWRIWLLYRQSWFDMSDRLRRHNQEW